MMHNLIVFLNEFMNENKIELTKNKIKIKNINNK